jgi:uncharacterized membrane protein YqaE (UPF0057 family)
MSVGKRLGAALLAALVPPLGAWLARGLRAGVLVNAALFLLAHGIFWGFAALPGVALYGLAWLHGLWLALVPGRTAEGGA